MKEFINAIQTADIKSIELWLSEDALQIINTPRPVSSRNTYHSNNQAEIYPLVLAWQLMLSGFLSDDNFLTKHFLVFKKLVETGADFQCLKIYQNKKDQQQGYPHENPLLHQLCEAYIENLEKDEEPVFSPFSRYCFPTRKEIAPEVKQEKRECIIWLIKTLLAHNFDINETNSQGHTVLPSILRRGCLELINFFLENGVNIHYVAPDGSIALHHFMQGAKYFNDPLNFLKQILELGLDVNKSNDQGETPFSQLLNTAPEKLTTFFPVLQHYGLQLNATLKLGQREETYVDFVQHNPDNFLFLIKEGMYVTPERYLTAFFNHKEHHVLQDYLFEQANIAQIISSTTGDSALHWAISPKFIQRLLAKGANIHHRNKKGETPLLTLIASSFYSQELIEPVKLLLENGANIMDIDDEGNGVLHGAAKNFDLLTYLIKMGAPVNVFNNAGDSPLHHAVRHGVNVETAMYLIENGALIHCMNKQSEIPLDEIKGYIDDNASFELLIILLNALPKNYLPKNHQALLEYGCRLNNTGILQRLFDQGFDPHSSFAGELLFKTAQWAMQHEDDKTLAWLLDHGVDINYKTQTYGQNDTILTNLLFGYSSQSRQVKTQNDQDVIIKRIFKSIGILKDHLTPDEFTLSIQKLLSFLLATQLDIEHYWYLIHIFITAGFTIDDIPTLECLISNAIKFNDDKLVWFVLDDRCNKGEFDQLLETATKVVICHYRSNMILPLIAYGWDINKSIQIGYTDKQRPLEYLFGDFHSSYHNQIQTSEVDQLACIQQLLDQPHIDINFILSDYHAFENKPYHSLHWAIFKGWDKIVIRLLEPPFLVSPNLMSETLSPLILAINYQRFDIIELLLEKGANPNVVSNRGSPLQYAIRDNQENTVKLLLKYKADPNERISLSHEFNCRLTYFTSSGTDNKHPILFYAIDVANPDIVALLLENGSKAMLNLRVTTFFGDFDLLSYALSSDKSDEIVPLLLPFMTVNYENVRQALKRPTISLELLSLLFSKLAEIEQLQLKPLLTVLVSKHKSMDTAKWLLVQNKKFIYQKDFMGRNALYFIILSDLSDDTKKNQALKLFKLLLSYNLNPYEPDCEGQTAATYAFYNGTLEVFGLQSPLSKIKEVEFIRLKKQLLVNYKEFQYFNESLNKCAFKLIQLFGTAERSLSYLNKFYLNEQQNFQPIHNLCLFQLPMYGNWQAEQWSKLIIEKGIEFIKVLHLASQIEIILGKVPASLDEALKAARQITYHRENENPTLAALFKTYYINELGFNRVLDDYVPKSTEYIPDIEIDGAVFGKSRYVLKKLAKDDIRGWILGELTHCCQSIGNAGESYAMHGMTSPYSGFYAVFKRGKEKDIQRYTQLLSNAQRVKNIKEFVTLISKTDKSQQRKYLTWSESKAKELHTTVLDLAVLGHLKSYLEQIIATEKEGELIAQLWVWWAEDNKSFGFDSWERLRAEDDCLCEPFINEAANKLIEQGFQRVLLGQFGNTPRNLHFKEAENVAYPKDYFGIRDSHRQWLVKEVLAYTDTTTLQTTLASTTPNTDKFKMLSISAPMRKDNTYSLLISSSAFFKKAHEEYIIEHRHENPKIQQAYDIRFGLIAR